MDVRTVTGFEAQKRILVADDNLLIRRQVRRILEADQQIEICAEAEDGAEAVRKARVFQPDIVLLDVFMPVLSGLAAAREIRKASSDLPIVILTLYDSAEIQVESKKAGADAFLAKADGPIKLLETIREVLSHHSGPSDAQKPQSSKN